MSASRPSILQYIGQGLTYILFALFIGYLSDSPSWENAGPGKAEIKLSINHAAQFIEPCRKRSEEELSRLAPNMRVEMVCPRERSDMALEMLLDQRMIYSLVLEPKGFSRDGESSVYKRLVVTAGDHRLQVRMKDHMALKDYNYQLDKVHRFTADKITVIRFDKLEGGFVIE